MQYANFSITFIIIYHGWREKNVEYLYVLLSDASSFLDKVVKKKNVFEDRTENTSAEQYFQVCVA